MMKRPRIERALTKDVGRNMLLGEEVMMGYSSGEKSYQEHGGLVCFTYSMYDIVRINEETEMKPSVEQQHLRLYCSSGLIRSPRRRLRYEP